MAKVLRRAQIIFYEKKTHREFYMVTATKKSLFSYSSCIELWASNIQHWNDKLRLEEQASLVSSRQISEEDGTNWYTDDKGRLHREDGPAIDLFPVFKQWYLRGEFLTFEEYYKKQRKTIHAPKIMAYVLGSHRFA